MSDTGGFDEVPFDGIPNQSNLFLNYVGLSPEALSYFQRPPTLQAITDFAHSGLKGAVFPRREMRAILQRQNEHFGADARCLQYIEDLAHPDSFAVVTGQQTGLFTGPLYTIYKAFTAIRIAEELRARNILAIPVFWLDTDDHDLGEVTRCTVVGTDSSISVVDYRQQLFGGIEESTKPVGSIEFPQTIHQAVEDYLSRMAGGEWKEQLRSRLHSAYFPGAGFADAFGRTMAGLFSERGLVLFDPRDEDAKRLASPLFQKALKEAGEINGILSTRSRTLQAGGFHNQVSILENSSLLFFQKEGQRKALIREGPEFGLKGAAVRLGLDRLLQDASTSPQLFSPNVLLRPVVQDCLFPTLCYVGGPGEIAYFAQAEPLYRRFERPMPAIWPRASFTLLDVELADVMRRDRLSLSDCFQGEEHVLRKMLEASGSPNAADVAATIQEGLTRGLEELRPLMMAAEASLGPALDTARRKILHQLEGLKTKSVQRAAAQNSVLRRDVELLVNMCYPNRKLQERELGICQFLARCGPGVMDTIYSMVDIESFAHRVIALG